MSRIFSAHHPYYPYDPYLHEELNQIFLYYLHVTNCSRSKDGKARKDHVIQTFWYKSESGSGSRIFHSLLPSSTLFDGECISL
jgi:hypothetical protein